MEIVDKPLFDAPVGDDGSVAILLVDCSGSTKSVYEGDQWIFDKFASIAESLPHENFRLVFWSSQGHTSGTFVNGIMLVPYAVKKANLKTTFRAARTYIGGTTQPHIGFRAVPLAWYQEHDGVAPIVYFMTDGNYDTDTPTRAGLTIAIQTLRTRLVIIAVECVRRDMRDLESVQNAAGGDVYRLVQGTGLTKNVMRFVSHTPNGEFVQISRVMAPPGFVAFGNSYFSETRVGEFVQHVRRLLAEHPDETKQLEVAQKLSITLEQLTKDKPVRVANDIVRTFSSLFTIDHNLVKYMLSDAIDREREGKAVVFANYRSQLKSLYQQADGLLKQDVFGSTGGTDEFVSFEYAGRILTGSFRLIDKTVTIRGERFPRGGFSPFVPVFPMLSAQPLSELQEQCLRQWTRSVYATLYGTHPTSDEVIYLVLANVMLVCNSDAPVRIKDAYVRLARVMLNKKRANSVGITEYDRLMDGEAPVPNSGKIEDFYNFMRLVTTKLSIQASPMKLWYHICCAISVDLARAQRKHCEAELESVMVCDMHIEVDTVPDSSTLDYSCIVTLEDVSQVGGHRLVTHNGPAGQCSPMYVLSEEGKRSMLSSAFCACPVCYMRIGPEHFQAVGPQTPFALHENYKTLEQKFANAAAEPVRNNQVNNNNNHKANNNKGAAIRNANGKTGTLVIMKGCVGCGKSTAAQKIKEAVEARGGSCYVEGTDKYCKGGMSIKDAIGEVTRALGEVARDANDDIVVVIDTCGENTTKKIYTVFDVNFAGWKKVDMFVNLDKHNMAGYFAWSLRNVLRRGPVDAKSTHYLTPVSAGVPVCRNVHKTKAQKLFAKEMSKWSFAGATVDTLKQLADDYEKNSLPTCVLPSV